ncbi:MAG: alkaline phosphatase family protein [Candidatus Dormibacterales bacterium]
MRLKRLAIGAMAMAGVAWMATPGVGSASDRSSEIPRYQHIVEIMMENQSYGTIIGSSLAPQINALAGKYGLATNYYGVTHPSEPNYMAAVAGSYFGVQDDNQFYCTPALASKPANWNCGGTTVDHTVNAPTLADQLTAAHKTWKGYFQSLPAIVGPVVTEGPNANGPYTFKSPSNAVALYASKHNPFVNFTGTQGALANMVPDTQLATDLGSGHLANYSLIVPNQCYDMHGTGGCGTTPLIALGDAYVGSTVSQIMSSEVWEHGNNAIVITWDEDDFSDQGQLGTGCCGANPGGGHVVTIVIRNHSDDGRTHVVDNTAYNHYSLLRTMEAAFRLHCLAHACDKVVPSMSPLFGED